MVIVETGELVKVFPNESDPTVDVRAPVKPGEILNLLHFYSQDPNNVYIFILNICF